MAKGLDAREWNERWDRMQERYTVRRNERFNTIVRLIAATQPGVSRVIDLGCGPGSLAEKILDAFPQVSVTGIDGDETLLLLAKKRLSRFGSRAHLVKADLKKSAWSKSVAAPVDAVVSSTAFHWLCEKDLAALYERISKLLRPGGIFLNADHVGSNSAAIQNAWRNYRKETLAEQAPRDSDDWIGFWSKYAQALGRDAEKMPWRTLVAGGVEQGLPLSWHLDTLRARGFVSVDCFWRCDGDAIYGGIREQN